MAKRTKNPVVWAQYACWNVQWWMTLHQPYAPMWFRGWATYRYGVRIGGPGKEPWLPERHMIEGWMRLDPSYVPPKLPPWWVGSNASGPLLPVWNRIAGFFRAKTGGRSHRCEFTDPMRGALYGHNEGPFMNAYFDRFLERIGDEDERW